MSETWNAIIAGLPNAHLLQTREWGQVKSQVGWQPLYNLWHASPGEPATAAALSSTSFTGKRFEGPLPASIQEVRAAALVLQRSITTGGLAARLRILYVPKGPLLADWADEALRARVLGDLRLLARQQGAIFIKIDPDVLLGTGFPQTPAALDDPVGLATVADLRQHGWLFSDEQIQFRNTVVVDLLPSEDELLARMKQKTRYNLRLAGRKGVKVRTGGRQDLGLLYRMYAQTSVRDGFVIRDEGYYRTVWEAYLCQEAEAVPSPGCESKPVAEPLVAEVDGEPVAGLILFRFAGRAWYLYGMSTGRHRERMPNYLLQWEAIRRAKAAGCSLYDLWGAPDSFDERDPLWGVFRFKEGLGGTVARSIGAWDLPVRPLLYRLYTRTLPRLLDLMRRRGRARTQTLVDRVT